MSEDDKDDEVYPPSTIKWCMHCGSYPAELDALKACVKEFLPLAETDPACLTEKQLDRMEELEARLKAITEG